MKVYRPNGRCNVCGVQVRAIRRRLHISQEALAAKIQLAGLDMTQKSISRIETGDRIVADYELPVLAQALETTVSALLGLE